MVQTKLYLLKPIFYSVAIKAEVMLKKQPECTVFTPFWIRKQKLFGINLKNCYVWGGAKLHTTRSKERPQKEKNEKSKNSYY